MHSEILFLEQQELEQIPDDPVQLAAMAFLQDLEIFQEYFRLKLDTATDELILVKIVSLSPLQGFAVIRFPKDQWRMQLKRIFIDGYRPRQMPQTSDLKLLPTTEDSFWL